MHSSGPGRTRATRGSTLEIASQSNAPGKGAGADKVASRAAPETGATRERARSQENETNDGKHAAGQQGRAMKQPTKSFTGKHM